MIYTFNITYVSKFPQKKVVRIDSETFDVELTISDYFANYNEIKPLRINNNYNYGHKKRVFQKNI